MKSIFLFVNIWYTESLSQCIRFVVQNMAYEMVLKRNPTCIHLYFDFIYVVLKEYHVLELFYVLSIYT